MGCGDEEDREGGREGVRDRDVEIGLNGLGGMKERTNGDWIRELPSVATVAINILCK